MKTVFSSNYDLIHAFAQQMQSNGRANSVFFETPYGSDKNYGTKLYSYGHHYLLAEFLDDNTVFINDSGYSVSTAKHISICRGALSQYKQFYATLHDINNVYRQIIDAKNKLSNARKPELYLNTIFSRWNSLNEFLDYCKKDVKKSKKYKELKKIVSALQNNPEQYQEKLKQLAKKQAAEAKKLANKQLKESLEKFFNYEINYFRTDGKEDYIRISKDGQFIETSQRVQVPIKEAAILYKMIKEGRDIKGHKIGYYTVISINGTLKIGCHQINRQNVNEIGEQII